MTGTNLHNKTTDEALMNALISGHSSALEILYDRYFTKLCGFVVRAFNIPDAEDVVQDIFIKIIENPQKFSPQFSFQTWIYTLTSNHCKNHLRNSKNRDRITQNIFPNLHTFQGHDQLDAVKIREIFYKTWQTFNEKEKSIYLLKYEHQFSHEEIGKILSIPTGSVKSGLFYLLKKLTDALKPHLIHDK